MTIHDDIRESVEVWDKGGIVPTIELGGLGPNYEMACQILVFEILRDYRDVEMSPRVVPDGKEFGEAAVQRCNKGVGGFSGAQVGMAKQLALYVLNNGWTATIKGNFDRHIQMSRKMPVPPPIPKE